MAKAVAKTGVDDYFAAGGTVAELMLRARPFKPEDLARERLGRDKKLQNVIQGLWADWRAMSARKMGECSERAVMRDLVSASEQRGKLEADGVRVIRSIRDIARGAQISLGGAKKALDRLVKAGRLRREMWGRAKDKPGAYVLLTSWQGGSALGEHNGNKDEADEKELKGKEGFSRLSTTGSDRGVHLTRSPSDELPPLRWPKVVHTWERRDGRRVVVDSQYIARLGKRREEIIRYVLEGGSASVAELFEVFGSPKGRLRDFRRRMLERLEEEGIFSTDGERVNLTQAWREALEDVRERDGEIEDARLQAEKYERQRQAFRRSLEFGIQAERVPDLPGKEKATRIFRNAADRDEIARLEEQRRKVGVTAEVFVHETLTSLGKVRMGLLREVWVDKGGDPSHIWPAVRGLGCKIERLPEHGNALFVFPAKELVAQLPSPHRWRPTRTDDSGIPAAVVPIRRTEPVDDTKAVTVVALAEEVGGTAAADDWMSHPLNCDCLDCVSPVPRYARPYQRVGGG